MEGFEPTTLGSQSRCSTKLSYTLINLVSPTLRGASAWTDYLQRNMGGTPFSSVEIVQSVSGSLFPPSFQHARFHRYHLTFTIARPTVT